MKKYINYFILFSLSVIFVLTFKYSTVVKSSIISSILLWGRTLIPSMLPIYIILDLLLNYGLREVFYKLFHNNIPILVIIALISGTPTNAKYIAEFRKNGHIGKRTGDFLLLFAYSPNPLFVLAVSPNVPTAATILGFIYLSNLFIFLICKPKFDLESTGICSSEHLSFIDCLTASIAKSADILIMILGIVVVYGVVNSFLNVFQFDSLFFYCTLELTNAMAIISSRGFPLLWAMFSCTFGGLSIHTQIKSILESTDLSYRYFLIGRIAASAPLLLLACFN